MKTTSVKKRQPLTWIKGEPYRKLRRGVRRRPTDIYASGESLKSYLGIKGIDKISEAYRSARKIKALPKTVKKAPAKKKPAVKPVKAWGIFKEGHLASLAFPSSLEALKGCRKMDDSIVPVIVTLDTKRKK